jgi:hypothetical protein
MYRSDKESRANTGDREAGERHPPVQGKFLPVLPSPFTFHSRSVAEWGKRQRWRVTGTVRKRFGGSWSLLSHPRSTGGNIETEGGARMVVMVRTRCKRSRGGDKLISFQSLRYLHMPRQYKGLRRYTMYAYNTDVYRTCMHIIYIYIYLYNRVNLYFPYYAVISHLNCSEIRSRCLVCKDREVYVCDGYNILPVLYLNGSKLNTLWMHLYLVEESQTSYQTNLALLFKSLVTW